MGRFRLRFLVGILVLGGGLALATGAQAYTFTTIDGSQDIGGTFATGINDNGAIVGYYVSKSGTHGFLDEGGTFTTINDPLMTGGTVANGINGNDAIVGWFWDSTGAGVHGFLASARGSSACRLPPRPSRCRPAWD